MRRITFDQHWGHAVANVACLKCGRISKRHVREYCTVNPFNKNADGSVKTPAEVLSDAQRDAADSAARQEAEGRVCRLCEKMEQS